jgi:spore germination cell wall hydrolase CwlJ-like protein
MKNPYSLTAVAASMFITIVTPSVALNTSDNEPVTYSEKQIECLALNIYHEARGQSELGQHAVAYVTLNRVKNDRYPEEICAVVKQSKRDKDGNPIRNKCQFSWFCDGRGDHPKNTEAYEKAKAIARAVINTYGYSFDPTLGATMYHADSVKPYWRKAFTKTTKIENHIFYR